MHYQHAFNELLLAEGGWNGNAKTEPGGGANYGITVVSYLEWKHKKKLLLDVKPGDQLAIDYLKNIPMTEVAQFYDEEYCQPLLLDLLTGKLTCLAFLDQAVNRGKGGLAKQVRFTMQKWFNVKDTGQKLVSLYPTINAIPDRLFFFRLVTDSQDWYVNLCKAKPDKIESLNGWLNRSQALLHQLV